MGCLDGMSNFLDYLDNEYIKAVKSKGIKHKGYIEYFPLVPGDNNITSCFECAKTIIKTRILYKFNTIRIDLTDYDIIYTICTRSQKFINMILNDLRKVYQKEEDSIFSFKIGQVTFDGRGFDYKKYNNERFLLNSDVIIDMYSFLFIVNMILCKDYEGQKFVKKPAGETNLLDKTLIKYISLILYYGKNNEQAKLYLQGIKFPICKSIDKLEDITTKKDDNLFTKENFDILLQFCDNC